MSLTRFFFFFETSCYIKARQVASPSARVKLACLKKKHRSRSASRFKDYAAILADSELFLSFPYINVTFLFHLQRHQRNLYHACTKSNASLHFFFLSFLLLSSS